MAKRLTAKAVENAQPRSTRYELKDGSTGLRAVIYPSGKRSWIGRYWRPPPGRRPAKITLDQFIPRAEARKGWATQRAELAAGRDPGELKKVARIAERKAAVERAADTVDHWAKLFLERYARKHHRPSTLRQCEHVFDDIM